jgi:hypothetical protein
MTLTPSLFTMLQMGVTLKEDVNSPHAPRSFPL